MRSLTIIHDGSARGVLRALFCAKARFSGSAFAVEIRSTEIIARTGKPNLSEIRISARARASELAQAAGRSIPEPRARRPMPALPHPTAAETLRRALMALESRMADAIGAPRLALADALEIVRLAADEAGIDR
jgi:hypothetical protein